MLRTVLLCIGFVAVPVWAADIDALRMRSSIDRNAQDQQFLRQQMELTRAQLRAEESRTLVVQSYIRLPIASRSDRLSRQADAPPAGAHPHQDELDLLAARYRDLEQQRRRLLQTFSMRVYQREPD